jgi:hypothetical protein
LDCFIGFRFVRLHQLVSELGFLSMAPITRKGGNRYASLHDMYEHSDSVHEDPEATPEGHEEDLQAALRARIEDLTRQLDESRLYDIRRRRRTPPQQEEEDSGSDDSYGAANHFAERQTQGRRPPAQAHANRWESGFKLDIPEFSEGMQPEEFLDWVAAMEEILEFKEVPDDKRVPLVATKFRGRAAAWWQQLKQTRMREGKAKITSWARLLKKMRPTFFPHNYLPIMYQRLQNCSQGAKSVEEYMDEFHQLLARVDLSESVEQLVSRYIGGLRPQIQDMVNLFDPMTISAATQRALLVEKNLAWGSLGIFGRGGTGGYNRSGGSFPNRGTTPSNGPNKGTTTVGQSSRTGAPIGPKCFRCGEPGHRMVDCRKGEKYGKGLLVDSGGAFEEQGGGEEQDATFDEDGEGEEAFLSGDAESGPLFMVRRVCFTPRKAEDEDEQRHNLFHSRCTIGGKVCQLVIDSGSCENVVAEEVVEKLALETEKHPNPYRLEWLKKGNEVIVTKRCLVSFSIGNRYQDKMLCDVVAMDACHLLLDRPWQYDRGAHHDGRKNTYSFIIGKVKITLLPSLGNSPKPTKGAGHSQSLLTQREFITEMLASKVVYVLVSKDNCKGEEVPVEAKGLMEEFADVFLVELPDELPPLRDIQHQIDLVPGSNLPNRPHYRMSPKEHEELRRQVEGLLAKGHIRESLSPCAVPALLTPKKDGTWRMCVDSRVINKITVRYRFPIPD